MNITQTHVATTDSSTFRHAADECKTFDLYCDRCGSGVAAAVYFKSDLVPDWSAHTYYGHNSLHRTQLGAMVAMARALWQHRRHECVVPDPHNDMSWYDEEHETYDDPHVILFEDFYRGEL